MHSKKVGLRGLIVFFFVIGTCLLSLAIPQTGFALVSYDDFSSTSINEDKWQQAEAAKEIKDGQLRLKLRSTVNTSESLPNALVFQDPSSINAIEAKATVLSFNNLSGARSTPAYIYGRFFNDGTGSEGQYRGDIFAQIVIGGSGTSPTAFYSVYRHTDPTDPTKIDLKDQKLFDLIPALNTPYTLSIAWDGTMFTFKMSDGITTEEKSYTPGGTVTDAKMPMKALSARISNNAYKEATVEALFDDVKINGSDSIYDDFSGKTIDVTKWDPSYVDKVRDIDNGTLRLKHRTSSANDIDTVYSTALGFTNPGLIKTMQATVTPLVYSNPKSVDTNANISGRYYNDGTLDDWVGDVIAGVGIGGTGASPVASWIIKRHTDNLDPNVTELVDTANFTTPIILGTPYTLYVSWDGAGFVFKVNDEVATYSPATAIHPPNYPMRRLQARVLDPGGQESVIEAKYDDVMIELATYQGTVGTQITLNDTGYGTKKGTVKVGGKTCKVSEWATDSITCEIKTALPPSVPYDIVVKPKEPKGVLPITYEGAFTMMAPEITSVESDSGSAPAEILISGNYFGTKKGKVYLQDAVTGKKKNCKVKSWVMDSIIFFVPKTSKSFPAKEYTLKVTNKVGEDNSTFTVE